MADVDDKTPTTEVNGPEPEKAKLYSEYLAESVRSAEALNKYLAQIEATEPAQLVQGGQDQAVLSVVEAMKKQQFSIGEVRKMAQGTVDDFKKLAQSKGIQTVVDFSPEQSQSAMDDFVGWFKRGADFIGKTASDVANKGMSGVLESLAGKAERVVMDLAKKIPKMDVGSLMGNVGILGAAEAQKTISDTVGKFTGLYKLEGITKPIEKAAYQTAIAFGASFDSAKQDSMAFKDSMVSASNESNMSLSKVTSAATEMASELGSMKMKQTITISGTETIDASGKAIKQAEVNTNALTAALQISNATGISTTTITQAMSQAHLQLGMEMDQTVSMFGELKESADKSGIGMEKTLGTVMKSAGALKMWGGTVSSVTPLFDMFASSLSKTGQQGLTPDMLEGFVSGLQRMNLSTRSFLGTIAGVGKSGAGAIGAGLEMEAALEGGGAGMNKVVGSLMDTLKQYGGGRVVTREEAIKDPGLQNAFIMQRQLLGQMLGLDEQTANKTLNALSGIQDSGLNVGSAQVQAIGDLISAGKDVAEKATPQEEKMAMLVENAIAMSGESIKTFAKNIDESIGIRKASEGIYLLTKEYISAGGVNKGQLSKILSGTEGSIDKLKALDADIIQSKAKSAERQGERDRINKAKREEEEKSAQAKMAEADQAARAKMERETKIASPQTQAAIGAAIEAKKGAIETRETTAASNVKIKTNVLIDRDTITIKLSHEQMEEVANKTLRKNIATSS